MRNLPIPFLFINLDRSFDRLTFMRLQAERLGLEFERISAVDALNVPDDLAGYFAHIQTGRLPIIDDGAIGCYASHLKALRRFEQTDAPAALILEDDALLPDNIVQVLDELIAALPAGWGFVHLSKPPTHAFKPIAVIPSGSRLVRYSRVPPGAAGYLISRVGATKLLNKSILRFWAIDTDSRRPWVFGHDVHGVVPPPIQQLPMPRTIINVRRSARRGLPRPTRFSWTNMPLRSPASFLFNLRQLGLAWWVKCAVINAVKRFSRRAEGIAGQAVRDPGRGNLERQLRGDLLMRGGE
jgi:glycosyl transferase family 25